MGSVGHDDDDDDGSDVMDDNIVEEDSDTDLPIKPDLDPALVDMTAKMDIQNEKDKGQGLPLNEYISNFQFSSDFFHDFV